MRSLLLIIATVLAAQAFGRVVQRLGQPRVIGELLVGLLLGASALGVLDPSDPVIAMVGQIGLLVLLFEIGLETDFRALTSVGMSATSVGVAGVIAPLLLGTGIGLTMGLSRPQALLCGASLTATSIGISARVLKDLGMVDSVEGRIVLGAAVLDDVLGLILLGLVSTVAGTSEGHSHLGSIGMLLAFGVGMLVHRTKIRKPAQISAERLGFVVVPVFFAAIGASVQLRSLGGWWSLLLFSALLAVGIAGKVASGYALRGFSGNRALIGWAMVPRGEVGLVFAGTAQASGIFDDRIFSIVTLVVMATTLIAPLALERIARRG